MQDIEPFYNWRHLYTAEDDIRSPFYGQEHSEFEYSKTIYNYYIHPQWDEFGSKTLYMKLIFADYDMQFAVIELIGEWNDAIENDIMTLKREVIDQLEDEGVKYFVLIGENVLNFHSGDVDYYEEWYDDVAEEEGWVALLNMSEVALHDFKQKKLQYYIELMDVDNWRVYKPEHLFQLIHDKISKRL
ncbi:MAG: hypothetical protein QM610_11025 [Chitinophagaceae bacterium]